MALVPMEYENYTKPCVYNYSTSATSINDFLVKFLTAINTAFENDMSYMGYTRWTGTGTFQYLASKFNNTVYVTIIALNKIYTAYIDSSNSKEAWEYSGTSHSL